MVVASNPASIAGSAKEPSRAAFRVSVILPTVIPSRAIRLCAIALLLSVPLIRLAGQTPVTPHAHKEHKRDYRREIEEVEEQWRAAQLSGDVATMDKLLADDYFGISLAGELNNKTQQLERVQKRMFTLTKIEVSDVKIKLVGRVGIVTSLARIEGTNDGRAFKGTFRYTRIYKRYPDGSWKITNFEVTPVPGLTAGRDPAAG